LIDALRFHPAIGAGVDKGLFGDCPVQDHILVDLIDYRLISAPILRS
jgi:hypothetical protein